jgi:hypothetical protein
MIKHNVFQEVTRDEVPEGTWGMNNKSTGTFRARINARVLQHIDGEHYDSTSIASPVSNEVTIRCMFMLMLVEYWMGELLDVQGDFLHGNFKNGERLYMEVPQGVEEWFEVYVVFLLLKTLYGLKQASMEFWRELLKVFRSMGFDQSKVDPCLYFKCTQHDLVGWMAWLDYFSVIVNSEGMKHAKNQLMELFDCNEVGNMDEHAGCD